MKIIPRLTAVLLFNLLMCLSIQARTFYNSDGKSIEAELITVEGNLATLKLKNGRITRVAVNKFSNSDQTHIKEWWQENKNKITERDVRLTMRQKNYFTKKPETKIIKNKGRIRTSESEFNYLCKLDNYSAKTVNGIKAIFNIHKRVSKRGKNGSSSEVKIVTNSLQLDLLQSKGSLKFASDGVKCSSLSDTANNQSLRETIIGMEMTLYADGKEILTQCHPENFSRFLEEQEARNEKKEIANEIREDNKDIADGKRDAFGQGRKYDEDVARDKRKRAAADAVAQRKAEEQAARDKNKEKFKDRQR